jgi:O-antigen/teichoic acid export membrane protein/SAM-dependent methyltransferase
MQSDLIQAEVGQESASSRLFSDASFNFSGRIILTAVGIFILPLMLHRLGVAVYGVWLAALAVASLCATFDLGMGWAVTRETAGSRPGDPDTVAFLRTAMVGFVLIGIAGALVIAGVGLLFGQQLHSHGLTPSEVKLVFLLVGLAFLGDWMLTYVQCLLYGLRRFDLWNWLLISLTVTRAAGIVVLLSVLGGGLPAVAVWHSLCSLLGAVIGIWIAGRRAFLFSRDGAWISTANLRARLSFGIFSQLSAIAVSALWQAGPILLGYTSSTSAVTSLGVGQRLPAAVSGLGTSLAETVFPAAAEHKSREEIEKSRSVLLNGTRWTLWAVLPACLILIAVGPQVLELWIGSHDVAAAVVVRLVSLAILCDAAAAASQNMLWGRGRSGLLLMIFAPTTCGAALAMYVFGRHGGAPAIAACILIATLIASALLVVAATRELGLGVGEWVRWSLRGYLTASLIAAAIAYAAVHILAPMPLAGRLAVALTLAVVVWTLAVVAGGFNKGEWKMIRDTRLGHLLRSIYPLRLFHNISLEIADNVRYSETRIHSYYEATFSRAKDPYNYERDPRQWARFKQNIELLRKFSLAPQDTVCEVGCAEGTFTEILEGLNRPLVVLDYSSTALERARQRRPWSPTTTFRPFDLLSKEPIGEQYSVVVAMHVVEFARRSHNRRARSNLVQMVKPGGYLLLDTQRHYQDLENAWFRRWLYRGVWLNRFFASHPDLEVVEEFIDDFEVITIYRRRRSA